MSGSRSAAAVAALVLAFAGLGIAGAAGAGDENYCIVCHKMQDEDRLVAPTRGFPSDIHALRGLSCASCHGGDPSKEDMSEAMNPAKGFVGKPARKDVATMCVRCHGNAAYMKRYRPMPYVFSMDEFKTSFHYKHLAAGDDKAATCTNCHGVHGILPVKDPRAPVFKTNVPKTCAHCHNKDYMRGRTLPTDQYDKYMTSVHGKALFEKGDMSAPVCNDCHGNHGAAPPNVEDIAFVCGNCHGREGELFSASKAKMALTLNGRRGCVSCHSNHDVQVPDDRMMSVGPEGLCGKCHQHGTAAQEMTTRFHALKDSLDDVDSLVAISDRRGMEVDDAKQALHDASDKLVQARVAVHAFDKKVLGGILDDGLGSLRRARQRGDELLTDWRNRRIGMAASVGVIVVLILLLLVKIRRVESATESR